MKIEEIGAIIAVLNVRNGSKMDKDNLIKIANRLKEKDLLEKSKLKERIKAARKEVESLKHTFLQKDPELEKLYLFGSLGRDRIKTINFDIDLAVKSTKYMDLLILIEDSRFKIDLIDLNNVREAVKNSILSEGVLLYEKK